MGSLQEEPEASKEEEGKEMTSKYKVALIGASRWARVYCETIREYFPEIEITALLRRRDERPSFIPDSCQVYTDIDALFYNHIRLDGIIIASDNPGEIVRECIHYDIPILAEKPLITDRRDIRHFKKAKKILVNYIHLFSPAFQAMKWVLEGKDILGIHSEGHSNGPTRTFSSLYDYGTHDLSQILSLTKKKPQKVSIRETKTDKGYLYDVLLTYPGFQTKSLVGNGADKKARSLRVVYEDHGIKEMVYDDLADYKLMIDGHPAICAETPPLVNVLSAFLAMMNGAEDERFGLSLTKKITEVLSEPYSSSGDAPSDPAS